jgi:bifunctional DNase/RNase
MIEVELVAVRVDPPHNVPVMSLRECAEPNRVLPIFIGGPEATAIALVLEGIETPRPMTHDLLAQMLRELGATLERVVVTELRDKTFYAELHLRSGDRTFTISSRPSDAVALAVRTQAPIFAEEVVLDAAGEAPDEEPSEQVVEEFREFIENVKPEDFGL